MRGTFNINTAVAASNWTPWIRLAEAGHELGNHTRHHLRLADIPVADARAEIEGGREDLLANIPGLVDVVSFTYPEGQSSPEIRAIVMETHLSARGYWGWNQPTPEDYSRISGRSYRDPATLTQDLNRCVSTHTWLVQYFHAVGNQALSVEEFDTFLDLVTSHRDSLWVATQGEATKYTLERDNATVRVLGNDPGTVTISSALDPQRHDVPLTVRFHVLAEHIDALVIDGRDHFVDAQGNVDFEMHIGDSVEVRGATLTGIAVDHSTAASTSTSSRIAAGRRIRSGL